MTPPKWEATIHNATSYRITKQGFKIDNIIAGEWITKNNEVVFVPNPLPYFELYVDKGNYIGCGNLQGITGVPNKKFTDTTYEGYRRRAAEIQILIQVSDISTKHTRNHERTD